MPHTAPWTQAIQSHASVRETMDLLEAKIREGGGKIFIRIDQSLEAANAGLTLPPAEVLLAGNPAQGTALMQENLAIAIDLPLKFMAFQDAAGSVWLTFTNPLILGEFYGLQHQDATLTRMTENLQALAQYAAAPPRL